MEKIEDKRVYTTGKCEYQVKWKGLPTATWETEEMLSMAAEKIAEFEKSLRVVEAIVERKCQYLVKWKDLNE